MSEIQSPPPNAFFEDFVIGQRMITQGRTITEADIVHFAGLSGDYHPLHTNEHYAATQHFGRRIAHGLLGLSVTTGLSMQLGILRESVVAFRELTCKFSKPIFIGDTIHAELTITGLKPMPRLGSGLVELDVKLYNQHGEIVQIGTWTVIAKMRAGAQHG